MTTNRWPQDEGTNAPHTWEEAPEQHIVAAGPALVIRVHPTVLAQRAGDEAYDFALETTHDGNQAAVAYHQAYQAVARATGCGPMCSCPMCEPDDPQPGTENPANHAADLKGW